MGVKAVESGASSSSKGVPPMDDIIALLGETCVEADLFADMEPDSLEDFHHEMSGEPLDLDGMYDSPKDEFDIVAGELGSCFGLRCREEV